MHSTDEKAEAENGASSCKNIFSKVSKTEDSNWEFEVPQSSEGLLSLETGSLKHCTISKEENEKMVLLIF